MRKFAALCGLVALVGGASASARQVATGTPATVQKLLGCRSVSDPTQRLACYDREAQSVGEAIDQKQLVMIDKEQSSAVKRSVFGYSVSGLAGLLGGGELNEIEGVVAGVGQNADGGWTIRLADGSVWTQMDDRPVAVEPRHGDKVVVKRGTLGSYFLRLGNQSGFKVRRTD